MASVCSGLSVGWQPQLPALIGVIVSWRSGAVKSIEDATFLLLTFGAAGIVEASIRFVIRLSSLRSRCLTLVMFPAISTERLATSLFVRRSDPKR